jgi:hypothetical protein
MVDHPDFQVLTPEARLTLLVCRVGTQNTAASIFRYYREALMAQTGLTAERLESALCELESKPSPSKPWITRDDRILWVRNGLKHDPSMSLHHENHRKSIVRAVAGLPKTSTVRKFRRYYKLRIAMGDGSAIATPYPIGPPSAIRKGKDKDKDTDKEGSPMGPPDRRNGFEVSRKDSDQRRVHHREALMAAGSPYAKADTDAGLITAADIRYFRVHGQWPP